MADLRPLTPFKSVVVSPVTFPTEQDIYATAYLGRAIANGTTGQSYEGRIMADNSSRDVGALRQMLGLYQRRSGH